MSAAARFAVGVTTVEFGQARYQSFASSINPLASAASEKLHLSSAMVGSMRAVP